MFRRKRDFHPKLTCSVVARHAGAKRGELGTEPKPDQPLADYLFDINAR